MKKQYRNVDGILLVNKSSGVTSNFVLQRVKRYFNAKKAGHGGCLDPLATGMLVIALGEATKVLQYALDSAKEYIVEAKLGIKTNTADSDGEIINIDADFTSGINKVEQKHMLDALENFTGEILQIPPMYSALKKDGQPLYKLARNGIEVERAVRKVQVHSIDLLDLSASSFVLKVACSKGTYIRTLVEDLAQSLGTYAHVTGLHRTKSGNFTVEQMFTLEEIEQLAENDPSFVSLDAKLLPITSVLNGIPEVRICSSSTYYIRTGRSIIVPQALSSGIVSLVSDIDNLFVGLGEVLKNGMIVPRRLTSFSTFP